MRPIRTTNDKKNIASPISNVNDKISLMIMQLLHWQKCQPTAVAQKETHALKNDSVEDILEQEKKNNIAFSIWKFQTNFAFFLALFVRNKFVYQVPQERNLSTWDISQRGKYFMLLFTRRYVKQN